jgi:integrase
MTVANAIASRPAGVLPFPPAVNRDTLTVAELVDLYLARYAGRDASRVHYLQQWCALIGEQRVATLDADTIALALAAFAAQPARRYLGRDKTTGQARWKDLGLRSPATLNRLRSSLSAALRYGKRQRWTPKGWLNPVLEVEAQREDNARTRFLSDSERERLLRVVRLSAWPKLHLLVLMAITTGARRGELLRLTYGDLDLAAGTAYLRTSKNGQPRVLPLTPAVVAEIQRHGTKGPADRLFHAKFNREAPMRFDTTWRTALRQAGITDFRFHDLRHSCASYLAQSGASLLEIADVLGHQSLDVTKRYAHLTVDSKRQLVQRVLGGIGEHKAA